MRAMFWCVLGFCFAGVSCAESPDLDDPTTLNRVLAQAVELDHLQLRGADGSAMVYAPNDLEPFTGWAKTTYTSGQTKMLAQFTRGFLVFRVAWFENGSKLIHQNLGKQPVVSPSWRSDGPSFMAQWERPQTRFRNRGIAILEIVIRWEINASPDSDSQIVWYYENGQKDGRMGRRRDLPSVARKRSGS